MYLKTLCATAVAFSSLLMVNQADATVFSFALANHPDGSAAPPLYGFRLDELFNVTGGHDVFTFDFDHASSDMRLDYDDGGTAGDRSDDSLRIFGRAFGGLDTGAGYGDASRRGLWDIDFTYAANFVDPGAAGIAIKINPENPANTGTITPLFDVGGDSSTNGTAIGLVDEDGGKGFSFKFNNVDNHRLGGTPLDGSGIHVGWGWVNHSGAPHIAASDWLFTGTPLPPSQVVPEPSSLALLALGGITAAGLRRRRSRKS